ncbi:MAG: ATP-dependent Clp protease ATP-binding subunit [Candidatus Calescibacterium sp.]|nr:ATP-dependent Clp protease ATP-binding subunit [Candidatus Calescibacterium sp.]MCX7972410.1 ATP-dependent Clp protease ATP-binding subunit [bacterium]MDW8195699.1 ATP-dependent Clp protease ATP-binding subunit [Candidatus Calescibacterium sp.]
MIREFIEQLYNEYKRKRVISLTVADILIELDNRGIRKINPRIKDFLKLFSSLNIPTSDETIMSPLIKKFQKYSEGKNLSIDDFLNFLLANRSVLNLASYHLNIKDIKNYVFKVDEERIVKPGIDKPGEKEKKGIEFLEKHGKNLVKLALEGKLPKVVGREEEIQRLVQVLLRKTKNSPVLIGEAGVGKTAIVEALAQKIANKEIKELGEVSIYEVTISSLLAGTSLRGELEKKLEELIKNLENREDIILFIDEIHTIMLDSTISNIFKPALARGQIRIIGATTTEEYYKYIDKDPALERRFQPIMVEEPTLEQTVFILENIIPSFEEYHSVKYDRSILDRIVKLSQRYIPHRNLPDKVIDIIDEAATYVKTEKKKDTVELEDIKEVISRQTNIPVSKMKDTELEKISSLEELLKERIMGQDEAIEKVAKIIKISKAGLGPSKRPYGVFLFLGPTGVGKTYLAKVLAEILFESEDNLIRLDMSEFKEKHEVSKLLGAPPGYIGYDKDGILTLAIKKTPYAIILLDEIEKAHPEVFDIFLQVFDEGHLKDSKGRTLTFYDTVIIMTSNIGSSLIFEILNRDPSVSSEELKKAVLPEITRFLRPEIVNRIDEIIVFRPLTKNDVERIIDIELKSVARKVEESGDRIIFDESIKEYILEKGYNISFGARNIKRVIQSDVLSKVAEVILQNLHIRNKTIKVSYNNEVVVELEHEN